MAVYQKLLLSAGGGIISLAQQAEQSGTANILIGLGGTGVSCLRAVKGAVYERLQPDNPQADIPTYEHIKFIAVDSDKGDLGNPGKEINAILDTEFFPITSNNIAAAIKNEAVMATKPELSWMRNNEIEVPAISAGAGGKRQIGRYLIMDRSSSFINRLVTAINQAKANLGKTSVGIHIFAGISGGTGSGTFLDVCYMAQKALSIVGSTDDDKIFGYFFLPDVNLSKITDPATRDYVPRNGYAALKELDYCMNLEKNGGKFIQQYQNGQTIAWEKAPVDLCHLISATNTVGAVESNAYDYAMNVVSDYVMEFLAKSEGFTIKSHLSNVSAKVATLHKDRGVCNQYFVLGAASAQVPLKEINTYLASALFDRFSVISGRRPTQKDLNDLVAETGLVYENMYRVVKNAAGGDFTPSGVTHKEVKEFGNRAIEQHYEKERDQMMGNIEAKSKALADNKNKDSYISRIRMALDTRVCKQEYGPYFASQIVNAAQEQNLLNSIDGLIRQNSERMNYENQQSDRLWKDYHAGLNAQKAKPNKANVAAYENALLNLDMHEIELDVFKQINFILTGLRKELVAVHTNFYSVLEFVVSNLADTFAQNKAILDAPLPVAVLANQYVMPLITMNQIRPTLQNHVNQMNLTGMISQFMGYLLANYESWATGDEIKISKLVTNFFVNNAFGDFSSRTIMSYLEEKYGTNNVNVLTTHIYNDYMLPLLQKAEPLFWNNSAYFDVKADGKAGKMGYISVPQMAAAITAAGEQLKNGEVNSGLDVRPTSLSDRIYLMRSYCGLPMCAYQALANYENAYWLGQEVGRHYYEGKPQPANGNPVWDWRKLSSIIPQSLWNPTMPKEVTNDVTIARNLFQVATKYGFIRPKDGSINEVVICRPSDAYMQALSEKIVKGKEYVAIGDAANGGMLKIEIEDMLKAPDVSETGFKINCDAVGVTDPAIKDNIVCDYFCASPVFRMVVEKAVSVMMSANALLAELEKLQAKGDVQQNYFDALFTGMFVIAGPKVCYNTSKFGMAETIDLSLPTMKYGGLPLYQAYLSYQQMDEDTIQAIKAESDNRKNSASPQMIAALRAFKAGMSKEYMQFMQNNAKKHPAEYKVIMQFFVDLMTTLQTTAPLYGV